MRTTEFTEDPYEFGFDFGYPGVAKLLDDIMSFSAPTSKSQVGVSLPKGTPLSVPVPFPQVAPTTDWGTLDFVRMRESVLKNALSREINKASSREEESAKIAAVLRQIDQGSKPSREYTIYGRGGLSKMSHAMAYKIRNSSQARGDAFMSGVIKGPKHLRKYLPVLLNGIQVSSIADRGCGSNLISMKLAKELHINIRPDASCPTFQLPISNRKIKPLGRASVFVQFPGEPNTRQPFEFFVCHNLDTSLILGRKFLKVTETQTKFKHRLKDAFGHGFANHLPSLFSISEEDETQERLLCHINGSPFLARPDTGSAINVMSLLFARQASYAIDTWDRKLIRLGDGSIHSTLGTTHARVSLGNGSEVAEEVEFDIVDELDVPIILGEELLLEHDAFDQYAEYFTEVDSDYLDFGSIVLIGKIEEAMCSLKAKGMALVRIGKTKPAIVLSEVDELEARDNKEYHRRRREDARITKLVGVERQRAVDAESWRREQFLRHRDGGSPAPVSSVVNSRVSSKPSSVSNPNASCSDDIVRDLSEEAASYIALCT